MIDQRLTDILSPLTKEEQGYLNENKGIDRSIYMSGGNNTINNKKLLENGKLIDIRPHSRFVHFPKHSHDFIEMVYMCSGKTTHIVNGEKLILNEGEILLLGQNAVQEILPASKDDIAVNFIIMPEFFDSPLAMLKDSDAPLKTFVIDSLKHSKNNSCYMHFKVADVLPVQNLIENLIWTLAKRINDKRKINAYTMGLLFLQLISHTDRLVYANEEESAVIKVLRYIDFNYKNGSLTELSEKLHYNFNWLSREIKRKTGKTYTELMQEKRLDKAAFMLKNTDMNISDIASNIGYDNISYFHRLFKLHYGISPAKYRK